MFSPLKQNAFDFALNSKDLKNLNFIPVQLNVKEALYSFFFMFFQLAEQKSSQEK